MFFPNQTKPNQTKPLHKKEHQIKRPLKKSSNQTFLEN